VGHGNSIAAMKFSIYELDLLNNTGRYGLFYSQACHSGKFQLWDDCFAERWVNIPQKGGFAAIMNTGYGYGSTLNYDGPDNRYAREFYDALFSPYEKISRVGKALQDSKEDNIWRLADDNMYHVYYCKTLFGDPYVSLIGTGSVSAEFTWIPDYPVTGKFISFYDTSKGMITYRKWDFGDGQISQLKNPGHVYSRQGRYTVTLEVQDRFGYMSTISHMIQVKDQWNPRPIITPDYYHGGNFTITFSAEDSWDPDGSIVAYDWNFDDGTHGEGITVTHTFPIEGVYNVELIVTDNHGNVAKNMSKIILLHQFPPFIPNITQAPSFVNTGEICQVIIQTSDPESDQIQYGIRWDADGPVEWSDEWYNSNESCIFTHQYIDIGVHEISVKARDVYYAQSPWSEPIQVSVEDNQDPILEVVTPVDGIYLNDMLRFPFFVPCVFGSLTIQVNASDNSGVEKVLFYVDDVLHPRAEVLAPPYMFIWDESVFFKHVIIIKVFDTAGRTAEQQIDVWKFF
jgi:PKD repeat protein